jgi:hypothetical protein
VQQTNTGGKEMSAFARVCQPQGGRRTPVKPSKNVTEAFLVETFEM